jgi:hypothetical protein
MIRHVNCRPSTLIEGFALMGRAMHFYSIATASRTTCCSSAA